MNWDDIRQEFPCTASGTYLNSGTLGPVPARIMEAYAARLVEWNQVGPGNPRIYHGWHDRVETAREALAAWVGARPEDLAFADSVTDALNVVLRGLRLPPGSRILTSDQEHGALAAPLALLAQEGVEVEIIHYGLGGAPFLERVAAALETPTALVAVSHMSCLTGAMVDAADLARLCHRHGSLLLLDGAQTPGQIPLNLANFGADFYAFNGHKWMGAPVGCGALYVHPKARGRLSVTFTGAGAGGPTNYPAGMEARWPEDSRRFEYGTRNWVAWVTWGDVVKFWEGLPASAAYLRERELAATMAAAVQGLPGVSLLSPEVPTGGIVTVALEGWGGEALYEAFQEEGIVARPVGQGSLQGARLTLAYYNNVSDIEAARAALVRIARRSPPA
jgi:selenocysteine lyase/cysteine desulfurase